MVESPIALFRDESWREAETQERLRWASSSSNCSSSTSKGRVQGRVQDAMAVVANAAVAVVGAGTRRIAGPTKVERRAVFGKAPEGRSLEGLCRLWAEGTIGRRVVVLTGAGVSTGVGLPDFRDKQSGVYAEIQRRYGIDSPEDIFEKSNFLENPGPLCTWLGEFIEALEATGPSTAHNFLRVLHDKGQLLRCYTQNLDGLELSAGLPPEKVVMAHGSMSQPSCAECEAAADELEVKRALRVGQTPKCCRCGGPVKPDVVFFNEPTRIPQHFQRDLDACDLLLIMGTSLQVNPFAGLVARVGPLVPRVLINRDKVVIANCRHRTRQLDFNSPKAYRDLWLGGDCDEMSRHLASLLGWQNELQALERRPGRPITAAKQDDASPHSPNDTRGKAVVAPTPSTTMGRFSGSDEDGSMGSDKRGRSSSKGRPPSPSCLSETSSMRGETVCFSELSDDDLLPLGPAFAGHLPGAMSQMSGALARLNLNTDAPGASAGMLRACSNQTICTMISEVDEDEEDPEGGLMTMEMFDDNNGVSL